MALLAPPAPSLLCGLTTPVRPPSRRTFNIGCRFIPARFVASSVTYRRVCSLLAPCGPGLPAASSAAQAGDSAPSVLHRIYGLNHLVAATLALLSAGCGYTLGFRGIGGEGDLRRIAVPVFDSAVNEPEAAAIFTSAFRREVARHGLSAVEEPDAEAILKGRIASVDVRPIAFPVVGGSLRTGEYELRIRIEIEVKSRYGEDILAGTRLSGSREFLSGATALSTEAQKRLAMERIAESLAERCLVLLGAMAKKEETDDQEEK